MTKNTSTVDYSKLLGFDVVGPRSGAVDFKSGAFTGPVGAKVGIPESLAPAVSPTHD